MKKLKHFLYGIFVLFNFMLTGCSRVYEVMFDNLLLVSISDELRTPDFISNCRMEIMTSDKFNIDEYYKWCNYYYEEYGYLLEEDYAYTLDWEGISGLFTVPNGKGSLTLYSYDEKVIELSYQDGDITSCIVYEDDNVICEFNGTLKNNTFEQLVYYFLQGNLIYYNNSDLYKEKEVFTVGYAPNCEAYDEVTNHYDATGILRHTIVKHYKRFEEDENFPYYEESIDEKFFNPDGSEMTMADRLFENHEKFLVLSAGYSSIRLGDFYIVLIPKEKGKLKGYGATIATNEGLSTSYYMKTSFEYKIEDNEIICDEFFFHSGNLSGRIQNHKRRTLEIDVDYDKNIIVKGEFVLNDWEVDCYMKPSKEKYSDALLNSIQSHIDNR